MTAPRIRLLSVVAIVNLLAGLTAQQAAALEPWVAPTRASKKPNPEHADNNSVDAGKRIYERECLSCHGAKGMGDGPKSADLQRRPGNLADPAMWNQTDGALFWKISEGRAPMPATKTLLSEGERWHVINYVRTLPPAEAAPIAPKFALQEAARKAMSQVVRAYEHLCASLADKGNGATAAGAVPELAELVAALTAVEAAAIPDDAKKVWADDAQALAAECTALAGSGQDVARLRAALAAFSAALIIAIEHHGHAEAGALLVFSVASAGKPQTWIQTEAQPHEPFGIGGGPDKQIPIRRLGGKKR